MTETREHYSGRRGCETTCLRMLFCIVLLGITTIAFTQAIPKQYVFAPATSCEAPIPDYRLMLTVTDNCVLSTITQTPAPGTMLTLLKQSLTIKVRGTDQAGNFKEISFQAVLRDTVKPKINYKRLLTSYNSEIVNSLYDEAEAALAVWDAQLISESPVDSMKVLASMQTYFKNTLVTWSEPGAAFKPGGRRVWTFWPDSAYIDPIRYLNK